MLIDFDSRTRLGVGLAFPNQRESMLIDFDSSTRLGVGLAFPKSRGVYSSICYTPSTKL
jgi:hypothetical protein